MTTEKGIAPHETLELHELLSFKILCATKAATYCGLVNDQQLKSIIEQDLRMSQTHIRDLQNLIQSSGLATTGTMDTTNLQ